MNQDMYKECWDIAAREANDLRTMYDAEVKYGTNDDDDEQETLSDYLDEALDVEYILDSSKQLIGVHLYIGLGGPTIYIDTRRNCVVCSWGLESAIVGIDSDIADYINDYFGDCF